MIKFLKYFFEAIFVYIFFLIGKFIGLSLSRKFFSKIFRIWGPIFRSKKIIYNNLKKIDQNNFFLDKEKTISNMWANYGMTFIEYIFLKQLRTSKNHIEILGKEFLDDLSKKNKPVIFVSGHFANFELMSMEITKRGVNLATIYRPLNNYFLNFFMEYLRRKFVCKNQIKKGRSGVKDSMNYIKNNYSIALMIDQRVSEGERINLFNEEALTTTLPAQLALKYNLDIVPISIKREKDHYFKMKLLDVIKTQDYKNKIEVTKKLNQVLEIMIKENPDQWIWTHNRWK